jgi:hypothetical protein
MSPPTYLRRQTSADHRLDDAVALRFEPDAHHFAQIRSSLITDIFMFILRRRYPVSLRPFGSVDDASGMLQSTR